MSDIGSFCLLYKKCKICGEIKYKTDFPPMGGKKNKGKRKSFCKSCKERRYEVVLDNTYIYSFDTSILDKNEPIIIRGRTNNDKRYEDVIDIKFAMTLVEEGRAGIVHKGLIHNLYTRRTFRIMILERDSYTCHYCGNYGDTVDHIIPKSKGGITTPKNCICACNDCNIEKADLDYKKYIKIREGV